MTLQEEEQPSDPTDPVSNDSLPTLLTQLAKVDNSKERANMLFQWLIHPVAAKTFFRYCRTQVHTQPLTSSKQTQTLLCFFPT